MKKFFLLTVISTLISFSSFAQNDLAKEILSIQDSSELIVRNSRKLVNTRIHERNFDDLTKIISYANTAIDTYRYVAFYPWEEQVLSILSGDLDYFLKSAANNNYNRYAIQPSDDYLGQYAISIIVDEKEAWKEWFNTLPLGDEKKQVVRIFLGAIDLFDDDMENQRLVSRFLKTYPSSEYKKFVESFKKSFNFGTIEFEIGGGIWKINGELTQFVNPSTAFHFGSGGFSNRMYWAFYLMFANETDLLTPAVITDENNEQYLIDPGESLSLMNGGLKIGWLAYRNNWLKLYPLASLSGTSLELPVQEGRNNETITLNSTFTLGAGVCADFDLFHWTVNDYNSSAKSHIGLRLSGGYQSHFASKKNIGGSGYYSNVSLVWWLGKI